MSDEALAQVVFRARNVLGPYGDLIKTVRGVGFALDADVAQTLLLPAAVPASVAPLPLVSAELPTETIPAPAEEAFKTEPGMAAPAGRAGASAHRTWLGLAFLAFGLLLLASWLLLSRPPAAPDIDDGYGFTLADLASGHSDTPALFAEALAQEACGDRARAKSLMRVAHETDAATPLPALMLALWSAGSVDKTGVAQWLQLADSRMGAHHTPLVRLFRDYVAAEGVGGVDAKQVVASAGAILGLRPGAWRMRHARAHLLEYQGMRAAALNEIRQVEFASLGHRKRDQIIADIASFGDPDAAERILASLADDSDQAAWHYLAARVAWSRQDWEKAVVELREAQASAHRRGRLDQQWISLFYEAAAQVVLGRPSEAIPAIEQARALLSDSDRNYELDMTMLLAALRAQRGQDDIVKEEVLRIRELLGTVTQGDSRISAWLQLLRLSQLAPDDGPILEPGSAQEALWRAARLANSGNAVAAKEALELAVERGIAGTRLWDDTRFLQAKLGLPVGAEQPLDPPYPPLARVVLRRELGAAVASPEVGKTAGEAPAAVGASSSSN